nr:hypothetical protein [Tanacetum cinerariifolium]
MRVPDAMISDAIKKKSGCKYYMAKNVEIANVPNKLKKDVMPRKTRSLTITEEAVVGQKLKGPGVEDLEVQSLIDLRKGSKASRLESFRQKKQPVAGEGSSVTHNKYYSSSDTDSDATLYSSSSNESKESANKIDDAVNLIGIYLMIIYMEMMMMHDLLDETPTNKLMDFMSHPVYTDAQTSSMVHNPKEMFPDEYPHHTPSLPAKKIPYPITKSGLAKRRTTWFYLFLKSDINKDKNHIIGPSIVAIAKNFKERIQKDELSIPDLEGAGLKRLKNSDEGDVSKPRSFKQHMSKSTTPHPCFYNNAYTYLVDFNTKEKYTTSITKHYAARYYKEGIEDRILEDGAKKFVAITLKFLMKMVEDIKLGVESYQITFNLTKPTMFFEGIDQRIPFIMTTTRKGVMYLNQCNIKSLMKLSEVKKFSDDTLVKIQENLIDLLSKNKLGSGNKRLKGRDWTDYDVKSLREMLKKIDEILRHI